MKTLGVFGIGRLVHFKIISRSPFAIGVGATWPIVNANRAAVCLARSVPVLANGLFVAAFTFGAGVLFLRFAPGSTRFVFFRYLERASRRSAVLDAY